jgi:hypothetical protein
MAADDRWQLTDGWTWTPAWVLGRGRPPPRNEIRMRLATDSDRAKPTQFSALCVPPQMFCYSPRGGEERTLLRLLRQTRCNRWLSAFGLWASNSRTSLGKEHQTPSLGLPCTTHPTPYATVATPWGQCRRNTAFASQASTSGGSAVPRGTGRGTTQVAQKQGAP